MSTDNNAASDMEISCCASCGVAEIDDVKLKKCKGCCLVRYCGIKCQRDHWRQHKKECKKRAAELRDELLFKQPESTHLGDCPLCCLPMPLDFAKSTICTSCFKVICNGCEYTNTMREIEMKREQACPFCRKPPAANDSEIDRRKMTRLEANDPVAILREGMVHNNKGEYIKAFEYFRKGADLGDAEAHFKLSVMYHYGEGVEVDIEKEIYHLEIAAIAGHPVARQNLGVYEFNRRNFDRAVRHYIIAATQGEDDSMKCLLNFFKFGLVQKEDLDVALRAHKAAVDATKSPQREAAGMEK